MYLENIYIVIFADLSGFEFFLLKQIYTRSDLLLNISLEWRSVEFISILTHKKMKYNHERTFRFINDSSILNRVLELTVHFVTLVLTEMPIFTYVLSAD